MRKAVGILTAIIICFSIQCNAQGVISRPNPIPIDDTRRNLSGIINGHEWVDLGLPSGTKWATCNIGADEPYEYGDYFAWGEVNTKSSYNSGNNIAYGKDLSTLQGAGVINSSGKLIFSHDAAREKWGSPWRIPSEQEFEELCSKCKWEWTITSGRKGYKIVGPNGNSIFIPASGNMYREQLEDKDVLGHYWTRNIRQYENGIGVNALGFNPNSHIVFNPDEIYAGYPIRAVVR